jgi:hypothetical protein
MTGNKIGESPLEMLVSGMNPGLSDSQSHAGSLKLTTVRLNYYIRLTRAQPSN